MSLSFLCSREHLKKFLTGCIDCEEKRIKTYEDFLKRRWRGEPSAEAVKIEKESKERTRNAIKFSRELIKKWRNDYQQCCGHEYGKEKVNKQTERRKFIVIQGGLRSSEGHVTSPAPNGSQ